MPIAALSGVVHAIIIAAWVVVTLPPSSIADDDSLSNRVYPQYIPPPDKVPGGPAAVHEVVRFVQLTGTAVGDGVGQGPRSAGSKPPSPADDEAARQRDTTLDAKPVTAPPPPPGNSDSVFTVLDVDTAVVRSANSAAPAYPLKLLEARITGSVQAQYVVDTTGFADTASFRVMKATNPGFIDAVREALPYMRFKPAKIGPLKVRQLVEQTFTFRITTAETTTAAPRVKKP
jgi:hypothetical protein